MVGDLNPGRASGNPDFLGEVGGFSYFTATSLEGRGLWRTDGTSGTAVRIASVPFSVRRAAAVGNGRLVFDLDDGRVGSELWVSDGTAQGTHILADIRPGPESSNPQWFNVVDDILVFVADDGIHGNELWRTDGTEAGTGLVEDIQLGPRGSIFNRIGRVDRRLFFAADDGVLGSELWVFDTAARRPAR
jgi:ELWxxDGT repeat protein